MSEWVAAVVIAIGVVFDILGCVGLLRMPDVYTRLQTATKAVTLGTCLILLGVAISGFGAHLYPRGVKALLCMAFVLVTSPTAAHALARGAHRSGIKPTPSVVDKYAEAASGNPSSGPPAGDSDEEA